jgi:hypothetical protein
MGEWWYDNTGQNLLKGVEGSDDNPPRLDDATIVQFLQTIPAARDSFERVVPQMLPDEQERLRYLAETIAHNLASDPKDVEDHFQHILNTGGIRVCGPRGGGNWAPPQLDGGRQHA